MTLKTNSLRLLIISLTVFSTFLSCSKEEETSEKTPQTGSQLQPSRIDPGLATQTDNAELSQPVSQERLERALRYLTLPGEQRTGMDSLLSYPALQVVTALIPRLQSDPTFFDPITRAVAYQILRAKEAAKFPEGYEFFLASLNEPEYQGTCLTSLLAEGTTRSAEIVAAIKPAIADKNVSDIWKEQVLRSLVQLGHKVPSQVNTLEAIVRDSTRNSRLRTTASQAMFEWGSLEKGIDLLTSLQLGAVSDPLVGLGSYVHSNPDGFTPTDSQRQKLIDLTLTALHDGDTGTRLGARKVVVVVFGPLLYTGEGDDRRINSDLAETLDYAAKNESDRTASILLSETINQIEGKTDKEKIQRLLYEQ
jgi:hypothetical protein